MSDTARDEQGLALYTLMRIFIVVTVAAGLYAGGARGREERPAGARPAGTRPAPAAGQPTAPSAAAPAPARANGAGSLYGTYCQRCHEADGRGQRDRLPGIPNFRDRAWHRGRNDFELAASILDGKGARMPAFGDRLDDRQVHGLVAYLRGFGPDAPAWGKTAAGNSAGDFEIRFRQLKKELDDLQRQFNELSGR